MRDDTLGHVLSQTLPQKHNLAEVSLHPRHVGFRIRTPDRVTLAGDDGIYRNSATFWPHLDRWDEWEWGWMTVSRILADGVAKYKHKNRVPC